jgi:hypothetical protein
MKCLSSTVQSAANDVILRCAQDDNQARSREIDVEDRMDRLVTLDFGGRGIDRLYAAAREKVGKPFC